MSTLVPAARGDWAKWKQDFDDGFAIASAGKPWWSRSKSQVITIGGFTHLTAPPSTDRLRGDLAD